MSSWFGRGKTDDKKKEIVETNENSFKCDEDYEKKEIVETNENSFKCEEDYEKVMNELTKKNENKEEDYERQKIARESSNIHLGVLPGFDNNNTEQVNELNEDLKMIFNVKNNEENGGVKKRKRNELSDTLIALDLKTKENIKMPYDGESYEEFNMYYKNEGIFESRGREFTFKQETPKEETPKEETIFTFNDSKIMYLRTRDLDFTILKNLGYTSYDDYDKINGSMENNLTTIRIKNGEIISEQNEGIDIPFYDLNLVSQRVILDEIMMQEGCRYDLSDDNEFRFRLRKFQMNNKNLNIKMNLCSKEGKNEIFKNWARETTKNKVEQKNKKEMDGFVGYMNKRTNNSYIITKMASRMNVIKDGYVMFMDG